MTGRRTTAAIIALGAAFALPGAASAATKSVNLGLPATPPKPETDCKKPKPEFKLGCKYSAKIGALGVDVNAFFPSGVTIHKGDKVKFLPVGFHSFDFPPRGATMFPLIAGTGQNVSGSNDAAGQPFWFNGQPQVGFNGALAAVSNFGKKLSFTGKRLVSGLPLGNTLKPITVTFKKTGKFTYYCNVHSGMKGTVTVKAKGASIPSAKADKKALARQLATALNTSKKLDNTQVPANTVDVGAAGKHGEEFFSFVPNAVTIPTGSSLTFRMHPASYDVHTATTGPGNPEADPNDPSTGSPGYLGEIAASFQTPVFDPRAVYASEAPGTGGTLTPALHGNGFWNSGIMDTDSGTPLASSNAVKFGAPGKYDFYCMIHPFMHLVVTVQ